MKNRCRQIRDTLLHQGLSGLEQDAAAQDHLAQCGECFAVLESQGELERGLAELSVLDVSDDVVEGLLRSVEAEVCLGAAAESPPEPPDRSWRKMAGKLWRRIVGAEGGWPSRRRYLAAAAMLVLAVFLGRFLGDGPSSRKLTQASLQESGPEKFAEPSIELETDDLEGHELLDSKAGGRENLLGSLTKLDASGTPESKEDRRQRVGETRKAKQVPIPDPSPELRAEVQTQREPHLGQERSPRELSNASAASAPAAPPLDLLWPLPKAALNPAVEIPPRSDDELSRFQAGEFFSNGRPERLSALDGDKDTGKALQKKERGENPRRAALQVLGQGPARRFLQEQTRLEGLSFLEPAGYWANTYLPGDPVYRQLRARLFGLEEEGRRSGSETPFRLHADVRQAAQPFDPPERGALAIYLQSSRRSLEGRQRMLVQVGLQATERSSGRRPPLDLAIVLDLSAPLAPENATSFRALIMALAEQRHPEDRFRLLIAGSPASSTGSLGVAPDDFRHGPLVIAMDQVLGFQGSAGRRTSLAETMAEAIREVSNRDSDGPLGSSAILFATARPLGESTASQLRRLARSSAIGGITVSTLGLGEGIDRSELQNIALEGQGQQRWMAAPSEAAGLVDRELAATSRAVARALRLRIRLAPGVQLVDVLGSYRLDATQAEAVREAERSIDLHLARSLGIGADRGEDEDGIQVVIPAFFSGDAHVILLDVVAPGSGPIAEVTARFKDLVTLDNGVLRDHLHLPRGSSAPGPLELNVLKNHLAYRFFQTFETAGRHALADDLEAARRALMNFQQLLLGLQQEIPGLAQDRDLAADITLLGRYSAQLGAGVETPKETQQQLLDSLRLAARLKILPSPARLDE